ncbi:MAG: hypothetical protein J5768_02715, partial [Spirochaetales bacterium]|nr:hypothetical protein [Spirochaetales bacterium]
NLQLQHNETSGKMQELLQPIAKLSLTKNGFFSAVMAFCDENDCNKVALFLFPLPRKLSDSLPNHPHSL